MAAAARLGSAGASGGCWTPPPASWGAGTGAADGAPAGAGTRAGWPAPAAGTLAAAGAAAAEERNKHGL